MSFIFIDPLDDDERDTNDKLDSVLVRRTDPLMLPFERSPFAPPLPSLLTLTAPPPLAALRKLLTALRAADAASESVDALLARRERVPDDLMAGFFIGLLVGL